jgi:hypothetical protein
MGSMLVKEGVESPVDVSSSARVSPSSRLRLQNTSGWGSGRTGPRPTPVQCGGGGGGEEGPVEA